MKLTAEEKPEGARAPASNVKAQEFSLRQSHPSGQSAPPRGTRREPLGTSVRVKLPQGLRLDSEEIVQYVGLWSSPSEFYREAIRNERNRWVDEAHRIKEQLDKGSQDPRRSDYLGQEEGEAT